MGMIDQMNKGIGRFYIGNFEDQIKQCAIDQLLGLNDGQQIVINREVTGLLKERQNEYVLAEDMNVFVLSWNLGGIPVQNVDMDRLLVGVGVGETPCMIVIGCQEMVDLNATNILQSNSIKIKEIAKQWRILFENSINEYFIKRGLMNASDKYICLFQKELVGLLSIILIKESISEKVTNISTDIVKCGLGN